MRSPVKTRVMYPPSGFTSASTSSGKDEDLDPAVEGHDGAPSEPLGPEQGVGEVDEQAQGHEAAERVVEEHDAISSEPVAGDGVADREREEGKTDGHHDQVEHESLLVRDKNARLPEEYRACISGSWA